MKTTSQIIVMRHGDKDGDSLTEVGHQQARAMARKLASLGYMIKFLFYSGLNRARQTALDIIEELNLKSQNELQLWPEPQPMLNFEETAVALYGEEHKSKILTELHLMQANGQANMEFALRESGWARAARAKMAEALKYMALKLAAMEMGTALAVSHSPWTECAAVGDLTQVPYGLQAAGAVCYTVEVYDGVRTAIVGSEYIPPAIPSETN